MTLPMQGRTVALAEGRQLEELAQMLEQEGARTLRCPMFSILDAPDPEPVVAWLRELIDDRMNLVVIMTGEAIRRMLSFAEQAGIREAYLAALGRTRTLVRGPKPVKALKDFGLAPSRISRVPTTEGVIACLREESLTGQVVGVTRFGGVNETLENFLAAACARVLPVMPYIYAAAADDQRVMDLIQAMAAGTVDVLVLTSSPQIDRLFEIAEKHSLEPILRQGLERVRVAAVGPVLAETLRHRQAPVHICPEQGFQMKNLVLHIKRAL